MTYLGPISTLPPSASLPAPAETPTRALTTAIAPTADVVQHQRPFVERRRGERRKGQRPPLLDSRSGGDRRRNPDASRIDIHV